METSLRGGKAYRSITARQKWICLCLRIRRTVHFVVETQLRLWIFPSRTPSMGKLYTLKWKVFTSWCRMREWDPDSDLEFLQDCFLARLSPSNLKVYLVAIAVYHVPLGGASLGRNPPITCFLCATLGLRPAICTRDPSWDLAIVLEGISAAPFEPFDTVSERCLTFKTVFLLAISSLKRVGDLQALLVSTTLMR